jgi:hypothetical protein
MKTYRFEKSFGPAASAAGMLLILAGVIVSFFYITGLVLVILGAFTAFTDSSTTIDPEKKKMRFSNNIFGLIPIGSWVSVTPGMKLSVINESRIYRTYSRSNQQIDVKSRGEYIYLHDQRGKIMIPVKKIVSGDNQQEEINKLCTAFEIEPVHSDK